jgi:hypothetical protein
MLIFSASIYRHFALTWDFAIYHQAWWLIAHGNLAPFNTTTRTSFWGHHGEAILWPLALLTSPLPSGPAMLALQDLATVAAELVAFLWACDIATSRSDAGANASMPAAAVAACVLVVLLANPWTWWSIAQDFHLEAFMAFFALMFAWDVARGKRRYILWGLLLLSCGDVAAALAIGVGASAIIAGRRDRAILRTGLLIVVGSALWAVLLVLLGADQSHTLAEGYGYVVGPHGNTSAGFSQIVAGALLHPSRLLTTLYQHRLDIYGGVAAAGIVGLFTPWGAGVPTVVLLSNNLNRYQGGVFAAPGYQGFPATGFLAVGLASALGWINAKKAWLACAVAGDVVWLPKTDSEWIHTNQAALRVLNSTVATVPRGAEVIASQGIVGRFSSRNYVYPYRAGARFPIKARIVYFILTAYEGVETVPVSGSLGAVSKVATDLHASLLGSSGGIWVLRWTPPRTANSVTLPSRSSSEPAWALNSSIGNPMTSGPPAHWSMNVASNAPSGYAIYGAYWRVLPGQYNVTVNATTSAPVNVEVWNDASGTLLERFNMLGTASAPIVAPVDITTVQNSNTFSGVPPFSVSPLPPPPGELIEVRVWVPSGTTASISSVTLRAAPGSPAPDPPGSLESQ